MPRRNHHPFKQGGVMPVTLARGVQSRSTPHVQRLEKDGMCPFLCIPGEWLRRSRIKAQSLVQRNSETGASMSESGESRIRKRLVTIKDWQVGTQTRGQGCITCHFGSNELITTFLRQTIIYLKRKLAFIVLVAFNVK